MRACKPSLWGYLSSDQTGELSCEYAHSSCCHICTGTRPRPVRHPPKTAPLTPVCTRACYLMTLGRLHHWPECTVHENARVDTAARACLIDTCRCSRPWREAWEMFTIVQHDDSLVSIRNFQKRYFCIQLNGEEPPTHPSPHHPIAPHPPPPNPHPPSPSPPSSSPQPCTTTC